MRLPRVRFTVRQIMIAVAVVALGGWAWRLWLLSRNYEELSVRHAYGAATTKHIMYDGSKFREPGLRGGKPSLRELLYDYEYALADKYARAASRPWLPVKADPPRPSRKR